MLNNFCSRGKIRFGIRTSDKFCQIFGSFWELVPDSVEEELKKSLGITTLGGVGTYLDILSSLRGEKSKKFHFLNERLNNTINGWTSNFLSNGGKEVLIKYVASALTTYVVSCFRLPKTLTFKLTVAKFWWSSNESQQGLHWQSWQKLCQGKVEVGLDFSMIYNFNTDLLSKTIMAIV